MQINQNNDYSSSFIQWDILKIIKGQFNQSQYRQLINSTKVVKASRFTLYANKQPYIISYISHPVYERLIKLEISRNNITNIQSLQFMNAPLLQHLDLRQNLITSFKPLIKINSFNLDQLRLAQNCFRSGQILYDLCRTLISNRYSTLRRLLLYQRYALPVSNLPEAQSSVQDLSGLVKLNVNKLQILKLSITYKVNNISIDRIKQLKTLACLYRKYKQQVFLNDGKLINNYRMRCHPSLI